MKEGIYTDHARLNYISVYFEKDRYSNIINKFHMVFYRKVN